MHIHNIDLHYHAGQERTPDTSLEEYFRHARLTGRKILGVTDHLGRYIDAGDDARRGVYPNSLEGLMIYRREVDEMKPHFSDISILFAPEIGPGQEPSGLPAEAVEAADFFIFELPPDLTDDIVSNTDSMIRRVREMARFSGEAGRPAFIAHPFRPSVNRRLVKRDIEGWVTGLAPRPPGSFSRRELDRFFLLDIKAFGEAVSSLGIAVEINGNTHFRIRSSNLPAPLNMLLQVYGRLMDTGARFVPGSDLHGFKSNVGRIGQYVPFESFELLGLSVGDIDFLGNFPNLSVQSSFPPMGNGILKNMRSGG